nr:MAG TPA: hypothetical protein [Caudoviricetes sp.]
MTNQKKKNKKTERTFKLDYTNRRLFSLRFFVCSK